MQAYLLLRVTEKFVLAKNRVFLSALCKADDSVQTFIDPRSVGFQFVKSTGGNEVSSVRRLSAFGEIRRAKSPRLVKGLSPRTSTICSTACSPTPLIAPIG